MSSSGVSFFFSMYPPRQAFRCLDDTVHRLYKVGTSLTDLVLVMFNPPLRLPSREANCSCSPRYTLAESKGELEVRK